LDENFENFFFLCCDKYLELSVFSGNIEQ
jgi:hypothetical protein